MAYVFSGDSTVMHLTGEWDFMIVNERDPCDALTAPESGCRKYRVILEDMNEYPSGNTRWGLFYTARSFREAQKYMEFVSWALLRNPRDQMQMINLRTAIFKDWQNRGA